MNNLTLIIPAKYESESLPTVLDEIKSYNCKKKVILEPSDTETIESIKNFDCEIIFQSQKGYGNGRICSCTDLTKRFCTSKR